MLAVTRLDETGVTAATFPVGIAPAARFAARLTLGTSDVAVPGAPFTTSVNDPSGRCPKCCSRMSAAFWLSAPGRMKRLVRRSDRPEAAAPAARTATIQMLSTAQRKRIIVRAQRAIGLLPQSSSFEVSGD